MYQLLSLFWWNNFAKILCLIAIISVKNTSGSSEYSSDLFVDEYEGMEYRDAYRLWLDRHGKDFPESEAFNGFARWRIWLMNFMEAIRYKRLRRLGTAKYSKGMNQFSDMFFIEFENTYLHALTPVPLSDPLTYIPGQSDPAIDWRRATDEGGMPEMKNQGDSASGWAFATVDALEFHYFRMKGRKAQFSVKELIECTPIITGPDTSAVDAITYTSQQGLRLVSQYPDWSSDHIQGTCHRNAWKIPPSVQTAGAEFISTQYPSTLQKAICQKGPLILHIQVTPEFVHYRSGLFHYNLNEAPIQTNHVVLLVGYGVEPSPNKRHKGHPYWVIRNSWGSEWGEDGYMRMLQSNTNRFANFAIYPIVA